MPAPYSVLFNRGNNLNQYYFDNSKYENFSVNSCNSRGGSCIDTYSKMA